MVRTRIKNTRPRTRNLLIWLNPRKRKKVKGKRPSERIIKPMTRESIFCMVKKGHVVKYYRTRTRAKDRIVERAIVCSHY